jgi:L-aminopeptidase/D-esterase-like protein
MSGFQIQDEGIHAAFHMMKKVRRPGGLKDMHTYPQAWFVIGYQENSRDVSFQKGTAFMHDDITDVPGIRVGHDTNLEAGTGCTVILCDTPAVGGVDVRGGAPATRETDLLRPMHLVEEVNAVLLTGGSAYGLDAASGVMRYLEECGVGFDTEVARVPIVPAAAIFDLAFGSASVRPDAAAGYSACKHASA